MQDPLTDLERQILAIVVRDADYPPTVSDVAQELGRRSSAVVSAMGSLVRKDQVHRAGTSLASLPTWAPGPAAS